MISKIIQKEKERQEEYFKGCGRNTGYPYNQDCGRNHFCEHCGGMVLSHEQSLINLKEYMEDARINISKLNLSLVEIGIRIQLFNMMKVITEDIDELTKMIENMNNGK